MVTRRSEEPKNIGDAADNSSSKDFVPTSPSTNSDDPAGRTLPAIKAFSVQCAACLKWRLVPSKDIYEKIRQVASEKPFVCGHASRWRLHASCSDPSDFSHDGNLIWALDKPDIPLTPTGWERLVVFRGQGSTFADIYYKSPTGKRLRSVREVERFLKEHPEHAEGTSVNQFSFVRPTPLSTKKRKREEIPSIRK